MAIYTDTTGSAVGLGLQYAGVAITGLLPGIQIAWGRGDPDWDDVAVAPPSDASALVDEIGRRTAQVLQFVTPDVGGPIVVSGGHYSPSLTPTRHLYVAAQFDYVDGAGETVREMAAFIGTKIKNTVPPEQLYYEPDDLDDPGLLFLLDRFPALERAVSFRNLLEFVVTF